MMVGVIPERSRRVIVRNGKGVFVLSNRDITVCTGTVGALGQYLHEDVVRVVLRRDVQTMKMNVGRIEPMSAVAAGGRRGVVGLDREVTEAILYAGQQFDWNVGSGDIWLFSKLDGEWTEAGRAGSWLS